MQHSDNWIVIIVVLNVVQRPTEQIFGSIFRNYDGADHVSTRPCGGQHTMTYSARKANKNVK
jgi:hypothetical protein